MLLADHKLCSMSDEFPADVKNFLTENFNSVAQLEIILLMEGEPQRCWSKEDISRALYVPVEVCVQQLIEFQSRGLVVVIGTGSESCYQFQPASPELSASMARLKEIYSQRRVSVITAIYSGPTDKVRTFANAFKLRKDK